MGVVAAAKLTPRGIIVKLGRTRNELYRFLIIPKVTVEKHKVVIIGWAAFGEIKQHLEITASKKQMKYVLFSELYIVGAV